MSELITASNIDLVIRKNREVRAEVLEQTMKIQMNSVVMKAASRPQLALLILRGFGLVQMPIEDRFWSGAIFVKHEKVIPVLNTALPRANQYFAAWHEIYHLIFDKVSFDYFIENDNMIEERKAECFAASMLLTDVNQYFSGLPEMDFLSKIFLCMSMFQVPYKAVLVALYEYAIENADEALVKKIKEVFDLEFDDMPKRFQLLGLDDSLVKPSYVFNVSFLQEQIRKSKTINPEICYHKDNEEFLTNIMKELYMLMEKRT